MKINRYKIEGLHNQFSFEGKLDENVNILVGNNGSFKSTLLYILYYMLQSKKIHGVYKIKHASIHFDENEDFIVYRSFEGTIADIQEKAKNEPTIAEAVEKIQKKFSMDDIQNIIIGMEQYGYSHNGESSTEEVFKNKLGRSLHVRHLDAGSCNACDFEMGALGNSYYDLHRYGIAFVASPRHADLLMVTGVVTRNLEQALRMSYEAMPGPDRMVMACGACAAGGDTYGETYAIVGAADEVVPVDIYVPGCPPRPSQMIAALLAAADMMREKK